VMLAGLGSGPRAMEPLAERLITAGFRVVLPEPRGYGESVGLLEGVTLRELGNDVARAIESISTEPVVVIGHAFGNRIARMLASDRPDLVKAVVLLAAGGKYPPRLEATKNLQIYFDKSLRPFPDLTGKERFAVANSYERRPRIWLAIGHEHTR